MRGYDGSPSSISLFGMNGIKSSRRNSAIYFGGVRRRSGRGDASRSRQALAPQRLPSKDVRKTIFYLTIETDDAELLGTIRAALPQGSQLHVRLAKTAPFMPEYRASEDPPSIRLPELTARQRDIIDLLTEGLSNKEIGRKLSLSHFTVRNHIAQVMRLLDASTRHEVVARIAGAALGVSPAADLA